MCRNSRAAPALPRNFPPREPLPRAGIRREAQNKNKSLEAEKSLNDSLNHAKCTIKPFPERKSVMGQRCGSVTVHGALGSALKEQKEKI